MSGWFGVRDDAMVPLLSHRKGTFGTCKCKMVGEHDLCVFQFTLKFTLKLMGHNWLFGLLNNIFAVDENRFSVIKSNNLLDFSINNKENAFVIGRWQFLFYNK